MRDARIITCETCGGEGRLYCETITGYDPRDGSPLGWRDEGPCDQCNGTGREVIDVAPITLDDQTAATNYC